MSLVIAVVLVVAICCGLLGDKSRELNYQTIANKIGHWIDKFTNSELERKLLFELADNPDNYTKELNEAYKQIEALYIQNIKPAWARCVEESASMGVDKRQYWAEKLLIDRSSPVFNRNLETTENKLRILLAKRGYLRKKDAKDGSELSLSYGNPVEGAVLKWCADELRQGHIYAKITNDGHENKTLYVKAGDRFMQTIFIPYGITYSDMADGVRNGGWGSTGK